MPGQELRQAVDADADAKRIVDVAQGLEGKIRNNSIHAAAVVIADRPLDEIVPLQLAEDRNAPAAKGEDGRLERQRKIVTQYSMGPIEEIGLLKMDFLGLRNLDVIEDAVAIIERSRDVRVDMASIPLDDATTYGCSPGAIRSGVFQLESDGMREALKQIRPTEFNDIIAIGALYRPGAMRFILTTRAASGTRVGHLPRRAPAPDHRGDLRLRHLSGAADGDLQADRQLLPAEADDLRKAIGKKKRDLMATMMDKFLEGAAASGTQRRVADDLWSLMTAAADYSFNKSHAACYRADLVSHRVPEGQLPGRVRPR